MTTAPKRVPFKLPHATKVQFLQIYRLLLREATYLPDSEARKYWHNYITFRFKAYRPLPAPHIWHRDAENPYKAEPIISSRRASILLNSSQSFLRTLCRANEGFPASMVTVLRHTYGRIGRRKYELLEPYLSPETPNDDSALQNALSGRPWIDRRDNKLPVSDALRALAEAQKSQPPTHIPGPTLRRIDPIIPEKNSWGRPMPIRRVRNAKKRALATVIEKIMPPLPREEWERLGRLAHGTEPWEGFIKRRVGWKKNERLRVPWIVNQRLHKQGPRHMSRRTMKRFWATVFVQCPVVTKHPTRGTWEAEFGKVSKQGIVPVASPSEAWMFEGTDGTAQAKGYWSEYNRLRIKEQKKEVAGNKKQLKINPNVVSP